MALRFGVQASGGCSASPVSPVKWLLMPQNGDLGLVAPVGMDGRSKHGDMDVAPSEITRMTPDEAYHMRGVQLMESLAALHIYASLSRAVSLFLHQPTALPLRFSLCFFSLSQLYTLQKMSFKIVIIATSKPQTSTISKASKST